MKTKTAIPHYAKAIKKYMYDYGESEKNAYI